MAKKKTKTAGRAVKRSGTAKRAPAKKKASAPRRAGSAAAAKKPTAAKRAPTKKAAAVKRAPAKRPSGSKRVGGQRASSAAKKKRASPATRAASTRGGAPASAPRRSRAFTTPHPLVDVAGGAPAVTTGSDRSGPRSAVRELSWSEFDTQVGKLARLIAARFTADAVVGLAHGGVFVGGALASALRVEFHPVRVARRSRDVGHHANIVTVMPPELSGQRVLVVDDVAASGDSLELATRLVELVGAKQVAKVALVTRPDGYEPDFSAYTTHAFFVFPWDYASVVDNPGVSGADPDTAGA